MHGTAEVCGWSAARPHLGDDNAVLRADGRAAKRGAGVELPVVVEAVEGRDADCAPGDRMA